MREEIMGTGKGQDTKQGELPMPVQRKTKEVREKLWI